MLLLLPSLSQTSRYWQDKASNYEQQLLRKTYELEQLQQVIRQQRSRQQLQTSWDPGTAAATAAASGAAAAPNRCTSPGTIAGPAAAASGPVKEASTPAAAGGRGAAEDETSSDVGDFQSIAGSPMQSPAGSPSKSIPLEVCTPAAAGAAGGQQQQQRQQEAAVPGRAPQAPAPQQPLTRQHQQPLADRPPHSHYLCRPTTTPGAHVLTQCPSPHQVHPHVGSNSSKIHRNWRFYHTHAAGMQTSMQAH